MPIEDKCKKLTISVAAYNVADYLGDTLESCLVSNSELLEVIVVNDGSRDGTLDIAKDYERRYPGVFRVIDKPNGGYGSTLNAALEEATGRYFKFLDGDDWVDTKSLKNFLEVLSVSNEDVVTSPHVRVFVEDCVSELRDPAKDLNCGVYLSSEIPVPRSFFGHELTYKTSLLKKIGFRMTEGVFYVDVEYMAMPWKSVETVRVTHIPLYYYRLGRDGQSVGSGQLAKHHEDILTAFGSVLDFYSMGDGEIDAFDNRYVRMCLAHRFCTAYTMLCKATPSNKVKNTLMAWDTKLSKYPDLYKDIEKRSKLVRFLRMTNFKGYQFASMVKRRSQFK